MTTATDEGKEAIRPLDADVERALMDNHRRFLAFLEKRTGNRQTAEEILQSAFVRTLETDRRAGDGEGAITWFYRILRNALIDHARRKAVEQAALELEQHEPRAQDEGLHGELCRCFEALLPTLKPEYARLLRMVDLEGAPVKDAAAAENLTPNNASVRLHRARLALRTSLEVSCGACATHGCLDCSCARGGHRG